MTDPTRLPRRLHLLRHAKSSWADPSASDLDRPLNRRGHQGAQALAEHFLPGGVTPDLVLCSSARRAVETLAGIRPGLPPAVEISTEPGLYGASASRLLQRLRRVPPAVAEVLVIGHNPGLEDLVLGLAGQAKPGLLERVSAKYPTAALATLTFAGPWSDLDWGGATLETLVTPRDLGVS